MLAWSNCTHLLIINGKRQSRMALPFQFCYLCSFKCLAEELDRGGLYFFFLLPKIATPQLKNAIALAAIPGSISGTPPPPAP
jgi:hypothetical protein